jgi:prepilin-type N-terminal cleavage/methylation domain-containing protein
VAAEWAGGMRRQNSKGHQAGRGVRGFTLVEISIVLVIIGVILAATLVGVGPVLESSRRSRTNGNLDRIDQALLVYVIENGCLPCPAAATNLASTTDAGWSETKAGAYYGPNGPTNQPCAGASCVAIRGIVPWNTLGIKQSDATDAWNDFITYAVDQSLVVTAQTSMARTLPATYPAGSLSVTNLNSAPQTGAAAYVLVSHGPNRCFAYPGTYNSNAITTGSCANTSASEQRNEPTNANGTAFVQDQPDLIQGTNYFDDIVRYRTAPAIIADCGANACGNPS